MRKFGNVFPLEDVVLVEVVELLVLPPEPLLLLPPHPAATSASPTAAKAAVIPSHPFLRVKWYLPGRVACAAKAQTCLSARKILPDLDISTPEEPVLLEAECPPPACS